MDSPTAKIKSGASARTSTEAIRSARSVLNKNSLLGKYPKYPSFYHADWRDEDKTEIRDRRRSEHE